MNRKEFNIHQGRIIREMRKMYDITQKQLAKFIKRSPATLCLIESGRHGISTYQMYLINEFFNGLRNPN